MSRREHKTLEMLQDSEQNSGSNSRSIGLYKFDKRDTQRNSRKTEEQAVLQKFTDQKKKTAVKPVNIGQVGTNMVKGR